MTSRKKIFYVYVLLDPSRKGPFRYGHWKFSYKPFYVGKGCGRRSEFHLNCTDDGTPRAKFIASIKSRGKVPLVVHKKEGLTEKQAFDYERLLIAKVGRENLTNSTDGGYGGRLNLTEAARAKRSASLLAYHSSLTLAQKKAKALKISQTKQSYSEERKQEIKDRIHKARSALSEKQRQEASNNRSVSRLNVLQNQSPSAVRRHSRACSEAQRKRRAKQANEKQSRLESAAAKNGLTLMSNYVDGTTPLKHRCNRCGHTWFRSHLYTIKGHGCPRCNTCGHAPRTPAR